MDKVIKGRLAKRAKSFKEDIIDILSNLRSPPTTAQATLKPKVLPIATSTTNGNDRDSKTELLCVIEDLPSCIALNQHFTNVINKNILQVRYALKFYEDVVVKNTLELVPGSASVVLEMVFTILTTLNNVSPSSGEHSSSLISATNLVNQALSKLMKWSDDILLQTTTSDGRATPTAPDPALQSEVRAVVDCLKIAINDLVQVVIHKAANKLPPPSTPQSTSPALYEASPLRSFSDKDGVDALLSAPCLNRVSKSSDGSLLEDLPGSVDWSSDSLPEELDQSPPPKPPLPLKGLLSDFGDMVLSMEDPLTPPPLPPKKRSLGGNLSPMGGLTISPFSPGWGNPPGLPDLVPSQPWLNESFDSEMHINSLAMHGLFEHQSTSETRWEASHERRRDVTMATSSTSVFSSSSSSSFTSFNAHHHQSSSSTFQCSTATSMSSKSTTAEDHMVVLAVPPALPAKRRQRANRLPSQYDNVDQLDCGSSPCSSLPGFMAVKQEETEAFHFSEEKRVHTSGGGSSSTTVQMHREFSSHVEQLVTINSGSDKAPPLPPKKRHVKEYMAAVGQYSVQPSEVEVFRKTMEAYYLKAAQWQSNGEDQFSSRENSFLQVTPTHHQPAIMPPILPPKKSRTSLNSSGALSLPDSTIAPVVSEGDPSTPPPSRTAIIKGPPAINGVDNNKTDPELDVEDGMEEVDLSADLVLKQPNDDGPEVRGGGLNALITHAAKLNKDDYQYQSAFLTTYRTFITPLALIRKLIHRFHHFVRSPDVNLQRVGRSAFSLLIGVVDDLALSELEDKLMREIIDFQGQLISSGDLVLAKALRKKFLERCTARRLRNAAAAAQIPPVLPNPSQPARQSHLLDFKSGELAEQMTLLDAELFLRIEIPEVLVWAQEQNEEKSPNLNLFTEHFNKMSYWARSRILEQNEARDRERYVVKYIKIMKHLRRLNNFNSYLALLSALDSAPVRRLEWQKSITDGLQEYCALIDSSSSFRAYRQALAETQPPCIPYIGLILQDLTFVYIGNPDTLSDGRINFGKRWQQFHILENMRRFQKCHYQFKRNDRIVAFFNEFNDYLCEESMWQISESIRPRGSNNSSNAAKK